MAFRHTVAASPIGDLTLVADGSALVGIYFDGHSRTPRFPDFGPRADAAFAGAIRQLGEYFTGQRRTFDLELDLRGSAFEQRVWQLLTRIPYGETRTYGDLAAELGDPGAAQAVGNANGWNPISIVVPCHRVVGSGGGLTGYAGGVDRKRFLLHLEDPPAEDAGRLF
ncbi:methylated-DNA--[protein]-cysteine S-methyltransferase [Amycolatopsis jejuensis]|uniref:methylated-DNA--[protein]-cysteine S-methyltransferase n=1 Tax=Amycolatopsis jejuensis TaxID=330084 RepID=UPI000524FE84|nr:methylated-DNA--[protein]-cysteine S-methyltransferase [Amycolatopsis jejuensis]